MVCHGGEINGDWLKSVVKGLTTPKASTAKVRKDQSSINKFLSIIGSTETPLKKGYQWTMTMICHERLKAQNIWKLAAKSLFQSFSTDAFNWQLKLRRQGCEG